MTNAEIRARFAESLADRKRIGKWKGGGWRNEGSRRVDLKTRPYFDTEYVTRKQLAQDIRSARKYGQLIAENKPDQACYLGTRWRWEEADANGVISKVHPWRNDADEASFDGAGREGWLRAETETYACDLMRQGYVEAAHKEAAEEVRLDKLSKPTGEAW